MSNVNLGGLNLREIEELAFGWGKLLASEAFPEGPGLNVTLTEMEEISARASKALVGGAISTMADRQAQMLDEPQPCPTCGKLCEVKRKTRSIAVRGGPAELNEPVAHCWTCRRDFFPSASRVAGRWPRIQPDGAAPHLAYGGGHEQL
jgi:hypothetical protein